MCGIIGIANKNQRANEDIIFALKALEYRGYDSAGAIFTQNFELFKTIENIETLSKMIEHVKSPVGIGHTRWATHGQIGLENAHPIVIDNWAIVHNGIFENSAEIAKKIGYSRPKTETDTEILLALFQFLLKKTGDEIRALEELQQIAHGSYAIALAKAFEDQIFFVKKGLSPLICAKNFDKNDNLTGCAIASSHEAISKKAQIFELGDSTFGKINPNSIEIFNNSTKNSYFIDGNTDKIGQNSQENWGKTFLEMEIREQPKLFKKARDEFCLPPIDLKTYEEIVLIGCGSAYFACCIGKLWLNEKGIKASAEIASEWNSRKIAHSPNSLVILISQSGETADTISALRQAKQAKLATLGIVNKENSTISKEADSVIYLKIGQEKSVATSKAFTSQILQLFHLIFGQTSQDLAHAADTVVEYDFSSLAADLLKYKKIIIIGKNSLFHVAQEGALKIKEITYKNVEAFSSGELKHGYLALVDQETVVLALARKPNDENSAILAGNNDIKTDFEFEKMLYTKTMSNVSEIKTRNGKIAIFSQENAIEADYFVQMPHVCAGEAVIIYTIAMQLIALEMAKILKLPIDKPRNLTKAVTVE